MVDVPWNVAKFLSDKAKGYKKKSLIVGAYLIGRIARSYGLMAPAYMRIVTLGQETLLLNVAKLVDLGICRYNGLGLGELVVDQFDNSEDEVATSKARGAQDEEGGVSHHPNMTFTNRLRAMDDKLGNMDTNIYKLSNNVKDLTYVVFGMSEQYDQFYREFRQMRMEQERLEVQEIQQKCVHPSTTFTRLRRRIWCHLEVPNKLTHKSSNEGSGVNPAVLDEPSDHSSSSSSDSEHIIENITSEEVDDTKKVDASKRAKDEQEAEEHVEEK
ncbi:hypothetical protein Tco_1518007 [Tanacetum coccineum]